MTKRLLPVRDLQLKPPRVCATCKHGRIDDGSLECLRPNGPTFDTGVGNHWYYVCSGYVYGEEYTKEDRDNGK